MWEGVVKLHAGMLLFFFILFYFLEEGEEGYTNKFHPFLAPQLATVVFPAHIRSSVTFSTLEIKQQHHSTFDAGRGHDKQPYPGTHHAASNRNRDGSRNRNW